MAEHLLLIHDVLDAQLTDRLEKKIGRVDELIVRVPDHGATIVAAILIGATPRAKRIGKWAEVLRRAFFRLSGSTTDPVSRIPFSAVRRMGDTIQVDVDGDSLESSRVETWLRDHVVSRIPGGSGGIQK